MMRSPDKLHSVHHPTVFVGKEDSLQKMKHFLIRFLTSVIFLFSPYIYSQHISNSIDETLHREQDHFMTSFLRYVLSITIFPCVPFILSIISSVYLGFTASDCACPFGFFKLLFFYIHSFILYTNKRSPIPHNISFSFDVVVFYFELYMIVNNFVCWSLASIN